MNKKKILVIDDEKAILSLLKVALERTGRYEVATLDKGQAALATARTFKPDIVFLDINMPDMEGSAVAYALRSDEAFVNLPIVFLTGSVTADEVAESGGQIGGQEFLAKPINLSLLTACIDKHVR